MGVNHKALAAAARQHGLHYEMYRKARQLAIHYTQRELDRIVARCREAKYGLGVAHMIRLLTVDIEHRQSLLDEAIEGHWRFDRLHREILERFGSRMPSAGRRPRKPRDARDATFMVHQLCVKWKGVSEAARGTKLPPAIREALAQADEAISHVEELAARSLRRRRAGGWPAIELACPPAIRLRQPLETGWQRLFRDRANSAPATPRMNRRAC
jgi:predicted transposase YbfD/YdcC